MGEARAVLALVLACDPSSSEVEAELREIKAGVEVEVGARNEFVFASASHRANCSGSAVSRVHFPVAV